MLTEKNIKEELEWVEYLTNEDTDVRPWDAGYCEALRVVLEIRRERFSAPI